MRIRYILLASAFLAMAACKDRNDPAAPGEPLNDTVTVSPPDAPPVPEADDREVEVRTPDGKVEVDVPAPPPPPKPGQFPPPPPPPPKIKIK